MGGTPELPIWMALCMPVVIVIALPVLPVFIGIVVLRGVYNVSSGQVSIQRAAKESLGILAVGILLPIAVAVSSWHGVVIEAVKLLRKLPRPSFESRKLSLQTNRNSVASVNIRGGHVYYPLGGDEENIPLQPTDFVTPSAGTYHYPPLSKDNDIRLLVLLPGSFQQPLRGKVLIASLGWGGPAYEALSYTWADENGNMDRSGEIQIGSGVDQDVLKITSNCEAAIRRLRSPNNHRVVWVDAICIDQDNASERSHQVSLMSKIYVSARKVIVYTGEGTCETDKLFDWLNDLAPEDISVPSIWNFEDLQLEGYNAPSVTEQIWIRFGRVKSWTSEAAIKLGQTISQVLPTPQNPDAMQSRLEITEDEAVALIKGYSSRRWFNRVWVLQEVARPNIRSITILCGGKATSAERAWHALSMLEHSESLSLIRIFTLLRKRIKNPQKSHLLDILIETREREATDVRDKIFGLLSISTWMDETHFPSLKADYSWTTRKVFAEFSAFFIRNHGAGFFLALIKSAPSVEGLPSWAADWSVPWPNYRAVKGRDFPAGSRPETAYRQDKSTSWDGITVDGRLILARPRILQGFITRHGHMDNSDEQYIIEDVQYLASDCVLIEMYPGLSALLKRKETHYVFIQCCPHAQSEEGVRHLVSRWCYVVVDGEGPQTEPNESKQSKPYKGLLEIFTIR